MSLPNGCRIGKMSVHPLNWADSGADLSIEWYIFYRFHDPHYRNKYPKGYPKKVRNMNDIKGIVERRLITRALLENEIRNLRRGYNPILDCIIESNELEISPLTGLSSALMRAFKQLDASATKEKMENALVHIHRAVSQLSYDGLPVGEIRQRHLEVLLMKVGKNKEAEYELQRQREPENKSIPEKWGPEAFNSYRAYLQILFKQLKKVGATEVKPVDDIDKKKGIKKLREEINADELQIVNDYLKPNFYSFWRVIHIFSPLRR